MALTFVTIAVELDTTLPLTDTRALVVMIVSPPTVTVLDSVVVVVSGVGG